MADKVHRDKGKTIDVAKGMLQETLEIHNQTRKHLAEEAPSQSVAPHPTNKLPQGQFDIKEIWRTPELGRHVLSEDGDAYWAVSRGVVGKSTEGYHSRIEVQYEHDALNEAGTYNGRIEREEPRPWGGPFGSPEEASKDAKKSLIEFDRQWADFAGETKPAGTGSYAHVNGTLRFGEAIRPTLGVKERVMAALEELTLQNGKSPAVEKTAPQTVPKESSQGRFEALLGKLRTPGPKKESPMPVKRERSINR